MHARHISHRICLGILLSGCAAAASAQASAKSPSPDAVQKDFAAAATAYQAGRYADAASMLELLLPRAPKNFQVHELLGLTYAAQSRTAEAVSQLQAAVDLDPHSGQARSNLATGLVHEGKLPQAEAAYRKALELAPQDYETNRHLAGLYLQSNRIAYALPLLQQAQRIHHDAYDNNYDLALTYLLSGRLEEARRLVESMLPQKPSGELHNLLGRIDEKQGRFVEAANQFADAAHLDPSEDNLFVWGGELLSHRTYVAAIDVFRQGSQLHPDSPRLLIGLGMALYARGEYKDAIESLLRAADLKPGDARCYLYLSKAFLSSPDQADAVITRFQRYAELEPNNAMAQYYYAIALWKGRRSGNTEIDYPAVQSLLEKSVALDGASADAHLQLGILYTDQHAYEKAFPQYQRALQLDPASPDAHFRMGRYYLHAGEKEKAQIEFDRFKDLQAQHHAEEDKAKSEVQQFVVSAPANPSSQQ
jgi:tetratricopeptide (TPR) repeat protein